MQPLIVNTSVPDRDSVGFLTAFTKRLLRRPLSQQRPNTRRRQ